MIKCCDFLRSLFVGLAVIGTSGALAVPAPNPRGASAVATTNRGSESAPISRTATTRAMSRQNENRITSRGAVVSNAARGAATVARTATPGVNVRATNARSATIPARVATSPNISRATAARATAVFSDISKIGGGYATCRDAYATCMDQFCANANDTYRRCYCSSRFADFRNTENAIDQAKTLLMQFEDNNLNAVDKTAAEVNAMYSATVGEAAIKKDTSAASKMLTEIGDLLSGKKKATTTSSGSRSLGILSLDLSGSVDDIWSDGGISMFSGGGQNLSELEGVDLYNAVHKQCVSMVSDVCEGSAVLNMARSSYSIMITQDCNTYQKNIDKKLEGVKQTVRQAEKYLREARLEEYRAHNSADVNECITKVRAALTGDSACGANYKRCLDYTGAYINQSTGEPIYSPRLFKLTELINLSGDGADTDVLRQNQDFNKFLESRKMFAATALDSCRSISNIVWDEFKRTALIEIAQAQDEKIEEVRMSCVGTMAECYDTQSSALKDFDDTTAQMSGALSAYAAKQMCMDKVSACAALFGNNNSDTNTQCIFDSKTGKLTNSEACGLNALLTFVSTVDNVRINEGCETALRNYTTELCTPVSGDAGYPWNCRLKSVDEIQKNISEMADTYCPSITGAETDTVIENIIENLSIDIADKLSTECAKLGGQWSNNDTPRTNPVYEDAFYRSVYGAAAPSVTSYGVCLKNTELYACEMANAHSGGQNYARYDATTGKCILTTEFYKYQCELVNGVWTDNKCYLEEK